MKTILAVLLSSSLLASCMTGRAHADANTSRTRVSKAGKYEVTYVSAVQPIPRRQLHAWTIELRDRSGHPIEGAELRIAGGMPDHGHGLPTKPYVREALGGGRYVVDGMQFNMGGYWVVDLGIQSAAGADDVRFELNL